MQNLTIHTRRALQMSLLRSSVAMTYLPVMSFAEKKPFGEKEKGDEKVFFDKQDEKVLKNLLKKMQAQQKIAEKTKEEVETYETNLKKLFKKHKIDEATHKEFFDSLIEWKKNMI